MANAGLSPEEIGDVIEGYLRDGIAYNVKTGESGKMIDMGIVDPLKVTKSALENAVSVSTTLLGTQCIIYNVRQK
jgi:chaperonin GroEL